MISAFTPPDVTICALRSGFGIIAGEHYTVRGMVLNRHWKTREPDPHVLLSEVIMPRGEKFGGEVGFPRDAFALPDLSNDDVVIRAMVTV